MAALPLPRVSPERGTFLKTPNPEYRKPETGTMSFEAYRKLCDAGDGFRKTGLLSSESYGNAINDDRTYWLACGENGQERTPALVPMEYADGYDIERTKQLAGTENTYLLSVPPEFLLDEGAELLVPIEGNAEAILIESDAKITAELREKFSDWNAVGNYCAEDFLDERIKNPQKKPASMSAYVADFEVLRNPIDLRMTFGELAAEFDTIQEQSDNPGMTRLITPDMLSPDLHEALWDLYQGRFEWLGLHHPVSMEDTRENFNAIIESDSTQLAVRFNNSQPVCMGIFIESFEHCDWLQSDFIQKQKQNADEAREIYFLGIAGEDSTQHYGKEIMAYVLELMALNGGSYRLLFESTNLSSGYIPRMVSSYAADTGLVTPLHPKKVAQMDYWMLKKVA